MYTFYTDKQEVFECKLDLEGASLSSSKARLVLESKTYNLMFYGEIDSSGKCTIPVHRLKNLLAETDTGNVKLEVIAEDTFFEPWKDQYSVETSKKVTVEVLSNKVASQPKKAITVSEVKSTADQHNTKISKLTERFLHIAKQKNITINSLSKDTKTFDKLCEIFTKRYKLQSNDIALLAENIVKKLK